MGHRPTSFIAIVVAAVQMIAIDPVSGQQHPDDALQVWHFGQPARPAAQGVASFQRQARNIQILVSDDSLRGRRTNALHGTYTTSQALDRLLNGTGLRWLRTGSLSFSIVPMIPRRRVSSRP